jgi:hypothetical protein
MNELITNEKNLQDYIFTIRGKQVMLDSDLAKLYQVETKRINEAVKRNPDKFPNDLMFELTYEEFENLRSQNATFKEILNKRKYLPKVFTEQGVYMLATVLKSKVATEVTLTIMRTFTKMKNFLINNAAVFHRLEIIEKRQIGYELTTNEKINQIFNIISKNEIPTQGIFYNGQIWDAYELINTLLKSAKKDVILIDNYIDDSVLTIFSKYPSLNYTIITKSISKQLKLDIQKYNAQYNNLTIKTSNKYHDRFLLFDDEAYHLGASLKDLGKKVFAFSKMDRGLLKV